MKYATHKTFVRNIFFVFSFGIFFLFSFARAATLSFSPPSGSFTVGNIFTTNILVNSDGQAINDAEITVNFPSQFLEVISVSKSNSIFPLWVEDPSFSNSAGTITFDGGVQTPGFTGSAGKIVSIVFQVKEPGLASVLFASAAVRANDGYGTDVFTGSTPGTYNLVEPKQTAPSAPVKTPPTAPITPTGTTSEILLTAPEITASPTTFVEGTPLGISGIASTSFATTTAASSTIPGATYIIASSTTPLSAFAVNLFMVDAKGATTTEEVDIDGSGTFSFIWSDKLAPGTYELYGQTVNSEGIAAPLSAPITIIVAERGFVRIETFLLKYAAENSLILLIILLLLLLIAYLLHRFSQLEKKITKTISNAESTLYKDFDYLRKEISDHIALLRKTQGVRELTDQEMIILNQFETYLDVIEHDVDRELKGFKK